MKALYPAVAFLLVLSASALSLGQSADQLETDVISTSSGELKITFIGHASLLLSYGGKLIHVDPDGRQADYAKLPKADLILVTHEHKDHCDLKAIEAVATDKTVLVANEACAANLKNRITMRNGEAKTVEGLPIRAVAAYNLVHMRSEGAPYHPKGAGNGYVIDFGGKKAYIAGDTENIP